MLPPLGQPLVAVGQAIYGLERWRGGEGRNDLVLAAEGRLPENGPSHLGVRVVAAPAPPGMVAHPLVEVHRLRSPRLLEEKIEYHGIVIQALVHESDPAQLASQWAAPRGRQVGVDSVQCSAQIDAIPEVLQCTDRKST